MSDVHDKQTRSYNMSQIKSKDTKPELLIRRYLHSKGFRYRLHVKDLPGKPDIVLPKYCTVIQVHGCFWHGHKECKYFKLPKTRRKWWETKISGNTATDEKNVNSLKEIGWRVIVFWECQLKGKNKDNALGELVKSISYK